MIRTALRLAAIMALNNGGNTPYPTMAGIRVYDSRIDLERLRAGDREPLLSVFTDDDGRAFRSPGDTLLQGREIDLLVDMDIETGLVDPGSINTEIGKPATTAELEAQLDLFEFQVVRALLHSNSIWALKFREIARVAEIDSARYMDIDSGARLAARQLRIRCMVNDDCFPPARIVDDPSSETPASAIPEPLKGVLDLITNEASPDVVSGTQYIADTLSSVAPEEELLARFRGVDFRMAGPPDHAEQGSAPDDPGLRVKFNKDT